MQDVDNEEVHEPGKDEADPSDFPSRHPLPETGDDKTEKINCMEMQNTLYCYAKQRRNSEK